jgi:hypothetical protein
VVAGDRLGRHRHRPADGLHHLGRDRELLTGVEAVPRPMSRRHQRASSQLRQPYRPPVGLAGRV